MTGICSLYTEFTWNIIVKALTKMKKHKYLIATAGITIGLLLLLLICRVFWLWPLRVSAGSMEPTVRKGDVILVNKLAYLFSKPKRGDVVFLDTDRFSPNIPSQGKWWIKRVIAIPGDRIAIRPPYIYINGEPLKDPPIFEKISSSRNGYAGYSLPNKT
jgi:signal peptidase I